jgi:hypothetical protein
VPLDFVVNSKLKRNLEQDKTDFHNLNKLIHEIQKLSVELDTLTLNFIASTKITSLMEQLFEHPEDVDLMKL